MSVWFALLLKIVIALNLGADSIQGRCRTMVFKTPISGQALENHTIDTSKEVGVDACFTLCYLKERCVSFNFGILTDGDQICELSSSDHLRHPQNMVHRAGFMYHYAKNGCSRNPCAANATCLPGDGTDDYTCMCPKGFTGDQCQPEPHKSCKEIKNADSSKIENKAYTLTIGGAKFKAYCHMTSIPECGVGPWTMVMKIDGSLSNFKYDSPYWSNQQGYNPSGGETGFADQQETKLPTYWGTPFTKLCIGIETQGSTRWIPISQSSQSLYHLLKDGTYTPTTLGKQTWLSFMPGTQLQPNCNKEGFNPRSTRANRGRVRIGMISNNENDCGSCNSYVGFGSNDYFQYSCGFHCDSGCSARAHGFGYILVQ